MPAGGERPGGEAASNSTRTHGASKAMMEDRGIDVSEQNGLRAFLSQNEKLAGAHAWSEI